MRQITDGDGHVAHANIDADRQASGPVQDDRRRGPAETVDDSGPLLRYQAVGPHLPDQG
jgi:hypothetical protein